MAEKVNKSTAKWVVGGLLTIILSLVGGAYASIDKRIDSKADKSAVDIMQKEVHELYLMHLRQGYRVPVYKDDGCQEKN